MVLASQRTRPLGGWVTSNAKRRRKRSWWPILLIIVLAIAGGMWYLWPKGQTLAVVAPTRTSVATASEQVFASEPIIIDEAEITAIDSVVEDEPEVSEPVKPVAAPVVAVPPPPAPAPVVQALPAPVPVVAPPASTPVPVPTPTPIVQQAPPSPPPVPVAPPTDTAEPELFVQGKLLIAQGKLVEARQALNRALVTGAGGGPATEKLIRDLLTEINEILFFSARVLPGDPLTESYKVVSGDRLVRIAARCKVPYELLAQINNMRSPDSLQVGQTLKLIKGPLHAVVTKHAFRLDVFGDGPDGLPLFICSLPVGLGEFNSTPMGRWVIVHKVTNPSWANPRTGEVFGADDPKNPLGEYWLGLEGVDEKTKTITGYGIHGTVEPQSIGQMASMGCVRLRAPDIEMVYRMLVEQESRVEIRP